jgi:DNA-directed RNA polymerase subunit omega
MHEELKEEAIINKVGGRFKLSRLIQMRMVALNTGARPLVEVRGGDKMTIIIQE